MKFEILIFMHHDDLTRFLERILLPPLILVFCSSLNHKWVSRFASIFLIWLVLREGSHYSGKMGLWPTYITAFSELWILFRALDILLFSSWLEKYSGWIGVIIDSSRAPYQTHPANRDYKLGAPISDRGNVITFSTTDTFRRLEDSFKEIGLFIDQSERSWLGMVRHSSKSILHPFTRLVKEESPLCSWPHLVVVGVQLCFVVFIEDLPRHSGSSCMGKYLIFFTVNDVFGFYVS